MKNHDYYERQEVLKKIQFRTHYILGLMNLIISLLLSFKIGNSFHSGKMLTILVFPALFLLIWTLIKFLNMILSPFIILILSGIIQKNTK